MRSSHLDRGSASELNKAECLTGVARTSGEEARNSRMQWLGNLSDMTRLVVTATHPIVLL